MNGTDLQDIIWLEESLKEIRLFMKPKGNKIQLGSVDTQELIGVFDNTCDISNFVSGYKYCRNKYYKGGSI